MCDVRLFKSGYMDFLVEIDKLKRALCEVGHFLKINGICDCLRPELQDDKKKSLLLSCLPEEKRNCDIFELNCYYIMFEKRLSGDCI